MAACVLVKTFTDKLGSHDEIAQAAQLLKWSEGLDDGFSSLPSGFVPLTPLLATMLNRGRRLFSRLTGAEVLAGDSEFCPAGNVEISLAACSYPGHVLHLVEFAASNDRVYQNSEIGASTPTTLPQFAKNLTSAANLLLKSLV